MNSKITASGRMHMPCGKRFPLDLPSRLLLLVMAIFLCAGIASSSHAQADGRAKAKVKGGPARWEETIKRFEAADAAAPPPKGGVLLVGGSNARRWTNVSDYFPQHRVINRGFGGARLADVLHYTDRIVLPYAPDHPPQRRRQRPQVRQNSRTNPR